MKSVRINARGKGFALLEVAYRYHIATAETEPAFSLKPTVEQVQEGLVRLGITASYQPPKGKDKDKQSNMVVLETALPSGYVVGKEQLESLKVKLDSVKRVETKNGDTVAIIYFDHLTSEPVTINIDGYKEHTVEEKKPASILIYDYYDNGKYFDAFLNNTLEINKIYITALSAREFYSLEDN